MKDLNYKANSTILSPKGSRKPILQGRNQDKKRADTFRAEEPLVELKEEDTEAILKNYQTHVSVIGPAKINT